VASHSLGYSSPATRPRQVGQPSYPAGIGHSLTPMVGSAPAVDNGAAGGVGGTPLRERVTRRHRGPGDPGWGMGGKVGLFRHSPCRRWRRRAPTRRELPTVLLRADELGGGKSAQRANGRHMGPPRAHLDGEHEVHPDPQLRCEAAIRKPDRRGTHE
jgi:hypothetical protein